MPTFRVTTTTRVDADSFAEAWDHAVSGVLESTEAELEFEPVEARHEDVIVRFLYLNEGYGGDFGADDPEDEPLLRCDVERVGNTGALGEQAVSACTQVNALRVDRAKLQATALELARRFHALGQESWKKPGEALCRLATAQVNA